MNIRLFVKVGKQDSNLDLTQPAPSDPRPVPVRVCKLNITCFVILIMTNVKNNRAFPIIHCLMETISHR